MKILNLLKEINMKNTWTINEFLLNSIEFDGTFKRFAFSFCSLNKWIFAKTKEY